uniref:Multimerin-2 n=1 Tax=Magallana gigas TaxID=29159 RepID=K1QCH2_MAGGI
MLLLLLPLFWSCLYAAKLTTLPNVEDLTNFEKRLTIIEQGVNRRLYTTERVLGQYLTGRNYRNLANLDVGALRAGILDAQLKPIIFSAYKYTSESSISTKTIIRFERTYINPGNHYHTEDGIFIAPVTGVYMFHWTTVSGSSDFTTQLMVDGRPKASAYVPYPGGNDSSSAMAIIEVNKDDHDKNLTSLEERLANLEKTTERRLNATERLLGQLLTGRDNANLKDIDVLALRSAPILFSAYKLYSESSISTKVTFRFEQTYINLGNHYHTEDGIFIAPVTGIYMFHWTIATSGSSFITQLMVQDPCGLRTLFLTLVDQTPVQQ